uniref:Uncharacterized protein n=1 Tax=Ananas comosus var. bracteatus TaxID=296719 RepID=A0A6V7QE92_ANACO|nr:unnamed protein product [Ananas comosus var. bracteatus]
MPKDAQSQRRGDTDNNAKIFLMIIKGIFRRYERWNPVHPTLGTFWGMGIGVGCGVGWGPGSAPKSSAMSAPAAAPALASASRCSALASASRKMAFAKSHSMVLRRALFWSVQEHMLLLSCRAWFETGRSLTTGS